MEKLRSQQTWRWRRWRTPALDAVPPLLDKLRQSILAAAFRGDLTADWRAKNPDVEPADKLLARVGDNHKSEWEQGERAKLTAKGRLTSDNRWRDKYEAPTLPTDATLDELPATWRWAPLDLIRAGDAAMVYGIILPGEHVPNGVPYVRPVDIDASGKIKQAELKRTSAEIAAQYARASLRAGDIVLSIVGTIGKVAVTPPELEGANITQSSVRIRPGSGTAPDFLTWALQAPCLTRQYDSFRFGNAVATAEH
jgi:type I restriction enzyme S subunit